MEIERKFLLRDGSWRAQVTASQHLCQGYLVDASALTAGLAQAAVRVRVAGEQAWLTIKSANAGIARQEFEYPIPPDEARFLLAHLCRGRLDKTRHLVPIGARVFEIDEFAGANAGLIVAEVELPSTDAACPRPPWLGREVSQLARYYNVNLLAHPWREWSDAERRGEEHPC